MAISEIPKEFGKSKIILKCFICEVLLKLNRIYLFVWLFFAANFSKKPFDIIDFGVCYLDDLIGELKDNKEIVIDQEFGIIKLYRKGFVFLFFFDQI